MDGKILSPHIFLSSFSIVAPLLSPTFWTRVGHLAGGPGKYQVQYFLNCITKYQDSDTGRLKSTNSRSQSSDRGSVGWETAVKGARGHALDFRRSTQSPPPYARSQAGQNSRKDRRCRQKTSRTENPRGTPHTPPG